MGDICNYCNTEVNQNYCPNCGHPISLNRIDGQYVLQEIRDVLNFERGILFTIKELAINPGKNIRDFLNENRNRLVKPIVFLIVSSLIYTITNDIFQFEDGYVNYSENKPSATNMIFTWVQGNYGYANIIMAIFIALWLKLFYRKYQFNFFEILILLCFVMGIGMLIYSLFGILESLTNTKLMQIAVIVGIVYTTYAVGQFFNKRKLLSYVKAFFAYILGMLTFAFVGLALGSAIDLIIS